VFVCLIPLGAEQSWQGDVLFLARNFSWLHYTGAENRKGSKYRIENRSHHHPFPRVLNNLLFVLMANSNNLLIAK
jgi:hypothetical protein